jgi:hypothetical protein
MSQNREEEISNFSLTLSNVIRGSLVGFYNQPLTPDLINKVTGELSESIYLYLIEMKS